MKSMYRTVGIAVVSTGLMLATGCAIENGHFVLRPPVTVQNGVESNQFQLMKQKAERGDAIAQFIVGSCYASGRGVAQNYWEAVKWYHLSADQGYPAAQNRLGVCYACG